MTWQQVALEAKNNSDDALDRIAAIEEQNKRKKKGGT